jgi:DNA invertase Pin-like site-specific DNA recombinase
MRSVTVIPATINRYTAVPINSTKKRLVAAYARVSTDNEEQLTSYTAQVEYYTEYIKKHKDWEFVGVYADEGISGCNTKHRDEFNRMVDDAVNGKINLILTKSVSRFARNTVDSLTTVRKLQDCGTEVYFEKENIWSFDPKVGLLLSIMSSLAQEESRSISENVKWGVRKRMADGKVSIPYSSFMGYDKGEDGNLVINEEQAVVVRKIFKLFLDGLTPYSIAKRLTEEGIPTVRGKSKWNDKTIKGMLSNEKFKGDALLQKGYIADFLSKKYKKNDGSVPQYYVEKNHEAIIEPEIFDLVQRELERRSKHKCRYSGVGMFASKIKCGECGNWYGSKVWHSNSKYKKTIYQCNKKFKEKCNTPHLYEDDIKNLFIKAINKLFSNKTELLENLKIILKTLTDDVQLKEKEKRLYNEVTFLVADIQNCITENARTALNQIDYLARYNAMVEQYESKKEELEKVTAQITERKERAENLKNFIKTLKKQETFVSEFDETLWSSLIDYITVYDKNRIVFTFKDGTEIEA